MFYKKLQPVVSTQQLQFHYPRGIDFDSLNRDIVKFNRVSPLANYGVFSLPLELYFIHNDWVFFSCFVLWFGAILYCAAKASKPPILGINDKGIYIFNLGGEEFIKWEDVECIEYRPMNMSKRNLWNPALTIWKARFSMNVKLFPIPRVSRTKATGISITLHYPDVYGLVETVLAMNRDKVMTKDNAYPYTVNPWLAALIILIAAMFFIVFLTSLL